MIVPVILSGGSGTRLWPLSREARPKQMLALTGPSTLLQLTAGRLSSWGDAGRPLVVASERHREEILRQLARIGIEPSLMLEPASRNTAPAIALAALECDPDDLLLVMPSDHVVENPEAFGASVQAAVEAARQGRLVTFGVTPDSPETGYGYIERGDPLAAGVFEVAAFSEKPDRETARAYVASGRHYWNAGIFLFEARAILDALRRHAPGVLDAAAAALDGARREGATVRPLADAFSKSPSISIDYAVMEKADRVAVVPVEVGWMDLGSWDALDALLARDADGNSVVGDAVLIDSRRCSVRSDGVVVAAVGVEDLIVVATGDAVLVVPKGRSQEVRRVIEELKRRGGGPL